MSEEFTPNALLSKQQESSVLFSKFNLRASEYGETAVYCFVEGYDMPYYQAPLKNILGKKVVPLSCGRKDNVLSVNQYIEQKEEYTHYAKRYFVDRDYTSNKNIPNSVWITEGYSIENYYLFDSCLTEILDIEFKTNQIDSPEIYNKCIGLFHSEHLLFEEAILPFNAWYCCLFDCPMWNRKDVSLEDTFPNEWINLNIGHIAATYTIEDVEKTYPTAPKIPQAALNAKFDYLREKGWLYMRGHYEMEFLFKFLSFLKDEPKKQKVYTVKSCSVQFNQKTMISTFSQYAHVPDCLKNYIRTGRRT